MEYRVIRIDSHNLAYYLQKAEPFGWRMHKQTFIKASRTRAARMRDLCEVVLCRDTELANYSALVALEREAKELQGFLDNARKYTVAPMNFQDWIGQKNPFPFTVAGGILRATLFSFSISLLLGGILYAATLLTPLFFTFVLLCGIAIGTGLTFLLASSAQNRAMRNDATKAHAVLRKKYNGYLVRCKQAESYQKEIEQKQMRLDDVFRQAEALLEANADDA